MPFEVPPLPYDYGALEPHIDEQTMRLHHDKHHQTYVDKANAALEGTEWSDRVGGQAGQHPGAHHQEEAEAEPEHVAGGRIQDLGRVPDDHVHHRQPEDEHDAAHAVAEVVADGGRVALDRIAHCVAQGRDQQSDDGPEQDPAGRHGDAGPGSSAGRPAVHDR